MTLEERYADYLQERLEKHRNAADDIDRQFGGDIDTSAMRESFEAQEKQIASFRNGSGFIVNRPAIKHLLAWVEDDKDIQANLGPWMPWTGGVCPVWEGTRVHYEYANGWGQVDGRGFAAKNVKWSHTGEYDVVRYRVVSI